MYNVLIVDDLEVLRYDLKRMNIWQQAGFAIKDEAENGLEALKKLKTGDYDLVITDIRMPVMDGMELLKEISENKLCPCVVLLSDYTEYAYAREGLVRGAFDYLGKPVDSNSIKALLDRVRGFLEEKKREKERVNHLESLAEEAFFPYQDVEKVAEFIIQGDSKAVEAADRLIDSIGTALDYDFGKAIILLKNALDGICSSVIAEHGWIDLYTDLSSFNKLDVLPDQCWQTLRRAMLETVVDMVPFLHKLILWKEDEPVIKEVCLEVLYHIEDSISIKSIAEKLYISKAYLSEKFKLATGLPLIKYITTVKMERAKFLLTSTTLKNYEIAEKLGYNDHEYFSKSFKKYTGVTPNAFRKKDYKNP